MAKKKEKQENIQLPTEFLDKLKAVKEKRAKTVIDHILKHGSITTEELRETYGYDHPPRGAQDVNDQGIPLDTFRTKGTHGRTITAYKFGDPKMVRSGRLGGRKAWPKKLKGELSERDGCRCAICLTQYEARYLQIDHRVPYQVAGDPVGEVDASDYMLLCRSCNRAKSWSCEHCKNWEKDHVANVCQTCYWANPGNYAHIALRLMRRLDITWTGDEVPEYDQLVKLSKHAQKRLPEFVKEVLRDKIAEESQ